ncbi:MAG: glucose-inhibited division protein [Paenibacillus sp.]|nr:glucose-inhibited division protein [Paenibacillus sp.]
MQTIGEPGRALPVCGEWDVIVCGGGPAGVAAAIAAARGGAKTCLLEVHGCLGGIWTAGALSYILDGRGKDGVLTELLSRLDRWNARQGFVCDVESTKLALEQMCEEAGVHVRLHTRVAAALLNEDKRLTHVITESKSGREAWAARLFIDATGDGDLGAHAGCSFTIGEEGTGATQPVSLIALVAGLDPDTCGHLTKIEKQSRLNLLAEIRRGGWEPSYDSPGLWHIRDDLYIMMANHEYGVSAANASDITRATLNARKELHRIVEALRSLGGMWSHLRLVSTGAQIGVREGRRIKGRYEVTVDDVLTGKRHDDAVCQVRFGIDVHLPNPQQMEAYREHRARYAGKAQPYDIPMRALIARDVDGLLLAGRCISGDFLAHASYRVTGNAVALGQAAGTIAAAAVRQSVLPQQLPWEEVKPLLDTYSQA